LDLARPLSALDAFDAGHERRVDVGRINGRPFINNVSLGVYAQMLRDPGTGATNCAWRRRNSRPPCSTPR
jgi:hypothetical protein